MKAFLALMVALLILGCAQVQKDTQTLTISTGQGKVVLDVKVVSTPQEKEQGLMFQDHLGKDEGMWFVFEEPRPYSFWMKNTLIPLDMIFVDSNLDIVDILPADPCTADPCPIYTPKADAKYVLEVNQNFTVRAGVKAGNNVKVG